VQGVQAHPQNFDLVKIRAESLKLRAKTVKIWAKWCDNLRKIA